MRHTTSTGAGPNRRPGSTLLALCLFLALLLPVFGCSLSAEEKSSPLDRELTLTYVEWEESAAVANLTAVALEDELDHKVVLQPSDTPQEALEGVADGRFDAFQGVWRPEQNEIIAEREGELDLLGKWFLGTTRASLAVPSYVGIRDMKDLDRETVSHALTLSPGASALGAVPEEVFERRGLDPTVFEDQSAMLEEAEKLYEDEEPFVMLAYAPHRMNLRFDLVYLENGELLSEINRPSTLHTAARPSLAEEDPPAYALLGGLTLNQFEVESLELYIDDAENPREGARDWAGDNERFIRSWVEPVRDNAT